MKKTFDIGKVVATKTVWDLMESNEAFKAFVSECLSRYILYDWGDIAKPEWELNDRCTAEDGRVIALYWIPDEIEETFEDQFWIITEGDRSVTTLLVGSDEYICD